MISKYSETQAYKKKQLIKKLNRIIEEFGDKKLYWLDRDELLQGVKLRITTFDIFNVPTEDNLFHSTVIFNNKTFSHVSKNRINNPALLSEVKKESGPYK